ncbi:Ubx domain-containing protein [Coemansia brasiliensis]|uniref:Ubx domain-containing protein n=1 Tax=Coemansia brasiliensis TaxID=2650707 RepID=A0A9W8LXH6_9FUNG|nr:Ubx domain-containing protein [Coemansia brasiliensis]
MHSPDSFALDDLTDAQKQSLQSFCQVTKEENVQLAVRVLKSRQWSVEQAVEMYYAPGFIGSLAAETSEEVAGSSQLRQRNPAQSSSRAVSQPSSDHEHREILSPKPQFSLMPLLSWPILLLVRLAASIINVALQLVGRQRITASAARTNRSVPYSSDRSQLVREFESAYGTVHVPFYTGTLAQAQEIARQEMKYLVVMLWSGEHDSTPLFEHALTQPALVECLSRSQFIVWAGDVASQDAFRVAESLGVFAFPFMGIIFVQQTSGNRSGLQLLARMDGLGPSANARHLANMLVRFVERPIVRHEQTLNAARREQQEREAARRLREQQNAAYERSLALDQERERARREQEERERKEREKAEACLREEQRREELCKQWRWAKFAEQQQNDCKDDLVTTLSLRLENGSRVVCKFAASATLQQVFDFVETREVAEEWAQSQTTPFGSDLYEVSMPKDYVHTYEFALVSQFPRVVFEDRSANLKDALSASGLWPSAALIVEPLFEPED